MATVDNDSRRDVFGATLTRRQFAHVGGALLVGVGVAGTRMFETAIAAGGTTHSLDPTQASSWFEIHADNTIIVRTGKVDFGQTTAHFIRRIDSPGEESGGRR